MPEDESRNDASTDPDSNASIKPSSQPPGNQNPPASPPNNNSGNNQSAIAQLEQEIRGGERWLIGIGIMTILVNIGIGLIYWGQLVQMRASVQKMDDAIAAANRGATAGETANVQSKDQFREDQRPYVWQAPGLGPSMGQSGNVKINPPLPATNNRVTCALVYKNYGRSPAIIIRVGGDVQIGMRPFQRFKRRPWTPGESVLPSGKSDLLTLPADYAPPDTLRGEVACYFRIQYQDVNGHPYETDMCFHGRPDAGDVLLYCPTALHLNRMIDCKIERCQ